MRVPLIKWTAFNAGTWVGASDGPRVVADNSSLAFLYLQHADDNLKIDSSYATYSQITLLQGNIGSAIELGTCVYCRSNLQLSALLGFEAVWLVVLTCTCIGWTLGKCGAIADGIGLRDNRVEHSLVKNIWIHRITHFDNQVPHTTQGFHTAI